MADTEKIYTECITALNVVVCNCEKNNEGKLTFKDNEVSLEDINSLIRICKINLVLE